MHLFQHVTKTESIRCSRFLTSLQTLCSAFRTTQVDKAAAMSSRRIFSHIVVREMPSRDAALAI